MFIHVATEVGLPARTPLRSVIHRPPHSDEVPTPSSIHADVVGGLRKHDDRAATCESLTASDLDGTPSPYTSTSPTMSSSTLCGDQGLRSHQAMSSPRGRSFWHLSGAYHKAADPQFYRTLYSANTAEPFPAVFFAPGGATAAVGDRQRKSRARQVQVKRVLGKLQERARTEYHLPIEIPPCVTDFVSEERLFGITKHLERLRARSAAKAARA